jgi:hypothetical protein
VWGRGSWQQGSSPTPREVCPRFPYLCRLSNKVRSEATPGEFSCSTLLACAHCALYWASVEKSPLSACRYASASDVSSESSAIPLAVLISSALRHHAHCGRVCASPCRDTFVSFKVRWHSTDRARTRGRVLVGRTSRDVGLQCRACPFRSSCVLPPPAPVVEGVRNWVRRR